MYKALKGTWGENKNKICFSDRPLHFGLGFCVRLQELVWVYLDLGLYIHSKDFSALLTHQHGCVVPESYFSLLCFCDFRGHCCLTINTNIKLEVFNQSFGRVSNLGKKGFSNLQHLSRTYLFFDWQVQCSTTTSCTDLGISAALKVEPSHFSPLADWLRIYFQHCVLCLCRQHYFRSLLNLLAVLHESRRSSQFLLSFHLSQFSDDNCKLLYTSAEKGRKANVRNTWSILG